MQLGIADHVGSVRELVAVALEGKFERPQGRQHGRFRVIDGG
jgi:hypothetical protein